MQYPIGFQSQFGGKIMSFIIRLIKYFSIPIIFIFLLSHCTHHPARVNRDGTPQREYSYQAPIEIDDGWQVSSLDKQNVNEEIINDMMRAILAGQYPNVRSIVLVKNGSIILEEYFYGLHRYMIQDFRSVTKSVTSELVGIAINKGFIKDVNEKLFDFFPEFEKDSNWDGRKDDVLVHHVLSMKWGFDESGPANSTGWYTENWITDTLNLPLVNEPGEKFEYHSAAPALFGPILEHASGMSVFDFAKKYLFEPLNISHYQWWILPDRSILTAGGLQMRPRDMAKIGYLILNKGLWHGRQILSEEWIDISTRAYVSDDELGYGYFWWLCKYKSGNEIYETTFAAGHGGQRILVIPKLKLVAVFTSQPDDNPKGHARISQIMTEFILPSMSASELD
jgi:CubicO group peptidase (beta-lactamase class C family)